MTAVLMDLFEYSGISRVLFAKHNGQGKTLSEKGLPVIRQLRNEEVTSARVKLRPVRALEGNRSQTISLEKMMIEGSMLYTTSLTSGVPSVFTVADIMDECGQSLDGKPRAHNGKIPKIVLFLLQSSTINPYNISQSLK